MAAYRFRRTLGILAMLAGGSGAAWAQSQKLAIVSCTSTPPAVPGYECEKAFDGNPATEWRVQGMSGSGQIIRLNFATLRRVKKISATWGAAPNEVRNYVTVDQSGSWRWASSVSGSQSVDNITLSWGEDLISEGDNMIWHSQAVIIEAYSSAVAGLREISLFGPGSYSDQQIQTATVAIPPWDITLGQPMDLPLSSSILASRIVGVSAFLIGNDNSVHNLTSLVPFPATAYTYRGAGAHSASGLTLSQSANQATVSLDASSFKGLANFSGTAKIPRGYVTVRYLSQDPEFQP